MQPGGAAVTVHTQQVPTGAGTSVFHGQSAVLRALAGAAIASFGPSDSGGTWGLLTARCALSDGISAEWQTSHLALGWSAAQRFLRREPAAMTKQFHTSAACVTAGLLLADQQSQHEMAEPCWSEGSPSDLCPPRDVEGTERQQEKWGTFRGSCVLLTQS